jgi:hypothetical protein
MNYYLDLEIFADRWEEQQRAFEEMSEEDSNAV